jgi:hypothetical protein
MECVARYLEIGGSHFRVSDVKTAKVSGFAVSCPQRVLADEVIE